MGILETLRWESIQERDVANKGWWVPKKLMGKINVDIFSELYNTGYKWICAIKLIQWRWNYNERWEEEWRKIFAGYLDLEGQGTREVSKINTRIGVRHKTANMASPGQFQWRSGDINQAI